MNRRSSSILIGALAGLAGALVFGAALAGHGMLTGIAGLFRLQGDAAGWAIHLVLGAIIGGLYGLWFPPHVSHSRLTDALASGAIYGFVWWCLGAMTLAPLLKDGQIGWTMAAAADAFPSLIGHLFYGMVTGIVFEVAYPLALARLPAPAPAPESAKTHVVILGGGFGGMAAATHFETYCRRHPEIEVTLVSDSNYSLFTPMLAEVASGALEAPHISSSVRSFLRYVRFQRAAVLEVDVAHRLVRIQRCETCEPTTLPYDYLLVALGSIPFDFGLPGISQHAFTLKTLQDAILLRDHVLTLLETADTLGSQIPTELLTFVVAGGGFSGMETVAELRDFVYSALRYYPNVRREDTRFVLVHSGEHVLPELSVGLADYAQSKLTARGIEFRLKMRVAGCTADSTLLKDTAPVPARTLVWTTGNRIHPVVEVLSVTKNASRIQTDATLRSVSQPEIWSVGDCAWNPDPSGSPYAPTAQNALRSGKKAAANILAVIQGKPSEAFVFKPIGALVVLGQRTAAAEIGTWKFSGLLAWLMWRGIYLSKLPGMEKKIRVLLDWIVEFFFPRDIVLTQRVSAPDQVDPLPERAVAEAMKGQT
ncbi:MAG: FAD-dependent oxidoreductase [Aggregatilineales bacterium]